MQFVAVTIMYPELEPPNYDLGLENAITRQIVCAGAEPTRWYSEDVSWGWYTVINCTEEQRVALRRAIKICFGGAVKVS